MDLNLRKKDLVRYLISGIHEASFTRGVSAPHLGFRSYNDFVAYQQNIINQFDENSILTLELIRNNLLPIVKVVDRPSMNTYKAAGFVFDSAANIVFYDASS